MRKYVSLFAAIGLFPACIQASPFTITKLAEPTPPNTSVYEHRSEKEGHLTAAHWNRSTFYPTQIVRIQGNIEDAKVDCDTVSDTIDEMFSDQIPSGQFFYNTFVYCGYNPETGLARSVLINSYFDPLSDQAIAYYEQYKADTEGKSLFGVPFHIEDAKGLIVSLHIAAGVKESPQDPTLHMFREDTSTHYFASNYDMMKEMVHDIKSSFYSDDPKVIMPFLDRWVFDYAGRVYYSVLRSSNYAELQPARIFVMEESPKAFTSLLRYYYGHNCFDNSNGHCL